MSDIVTFGEAMVRLSPPGRERIEQASTLDMRIGGAELNVAIGATRLGLSASWISRLPRNPLGRFMVNQVRQFGVDTSQVLWSDTDRMGVYYIEFGATPRPTSVTYDRADSAFARIHPSEIDWATAFRGAKVFHTTGITPALGDGPLNATREGLIAAKRAGLHVSFDPNYRAKLWSREDARNAIVPLLEHVDILVTNGADASGILGVECETERETAHELSEKYGIPTVAIPGREQATAWGHTRHAVMYADGKHYESNEYRIEMVDMVGGGDSFVSGLLYGILKSDLQLAIEYGVAFAALKHTNPGDINYSTLEELEQIVSGSGHVIGR